jgi:hypothetical protein
MNTIVATVFIAEAARSFRHSDGAKLLKQTGWVSGF